MLYPAQSAILLLGTNSLYDSWTETLEIGFCRLYTRSDAEVPHSDIFGTFCDAPYGKASMSNRLSRRLSSWLVCTGLPERSRYNQSLSVVSFSCSEARWMAKSWADDWLDLIFSIKAFVEFRNAINFSHSCNAFTDGSARFEHQSILQHFQKRSDWACRTRIESLVRQLKC